MVNISTYWFWICEERIIRLVHEGNIVYTSHINENLQNLVRPGPSSNKNIFEVRKSLSLRVIIREDDEYIYGVTHSSISYSPLYERLCRRICAQRPSSKYKSIVDYYLGKRRVWTWSIGCKNSLAT
jgi:hypothetical protein